MIRQHGKEWQVTSEDGKVLGTHPTKEAAEAQLRAIEASKHASHDESKPERYRVRGAEVFCIGQHRGKVYTEQDLDDMVRNHRVLCTGPRPLLRVPGKIGHGELQRKLAEGEKPPDESHLPAAGWASLLWRKGKTLFANLEDMAPQEAKDIASRRYRKISAEVYDEDQAAKAGITGHKGKVLRAIAFLGADQPQVKGLADVPIPERYKEILARSENGLGEFAFSRPAHLQLSDIRKLPSGAYACFSEVSVMDPEMILQSLTQHGLTPEEAQAAVAAGLAEAILRICDGKDQAADAVDDDKMERMHARMMAEEPEEEKKEEYRERARKYMERAKAYAEKFGDRAMDLDTMDLLKKKPDEEEDKKDEPMKYSEAALNAIVQKAVAEALAKGVKQDIAVLNKFREDLATESRKELVDKTLERLSRDGKIPPRELESEREFLMAVAEDTTVHKFSEGGKVVSATRYDRRVKALEARRSQFSERMKDPVKVGTGDEDKEKISDHYEAFSETFRKTGTTKEELLSAFEAKRKADPTYTADQFLAPRSK